MADTEASAGEGTVGPLGLPAPHRPRCWGATLCNIEGGAGGRAVGSVGNHLAGPRCRRSSRGGVTGQHQGLTRAGDGHHPRLPFQPPHRLGSCWWWRRAVGPTLAPLPCQGTPAEPRPASAHLPSPCGRPPPDGGGTQEGADPAAATWLLTVGTSALPVCTARLARPLPGASPTPTACSLPGWIWRGLPTSTPAQGSPCTTCHLGLAAAGPQTWEPASWEGGPQGFVQKWVRMRG